MEIFSGLMGAGAYALLSKLVITLRKKGRPDGVTAAADCSHSASILAFVEPYRTNAYEDEYEGGGGGNDDGGGDDDENGDDDDDEEDDDEEDDDEEDDDEEDDDEEAWLYAPREACPRCGKKEIRHLGRGLDAHDYDVMIGTTAGRAAFASTDWRRLQCTPRTLRPHLHFQCCSCGVDWAETAPEDYKPSDIKR